MSAENLLGCFFIIVAIAGFFLLGWWLFGMLFVKILGGLVGLVLIYLAFAAGIALLNE